TRRQDFAPTPIEPILDDVVDLFGALAEDRGIDLSVEPAPSAMATRWPIVHGDLDLIAGAVANLVDNALKYAGSGASIRVSAEAADEQVVIKVADNGPGVADEARER